MELAFQQGGMFTGLLAAHGMQNRYLGISQTGAQNELVDVLAELITFNVAGAVYNRTLGRRLKPLEAKLEKAGRDMESKSRWEIPQISMDPQLALDGVGGSFPPSRTKGTLSESFGNQVFMVGDAKGGKPKGKGRQAFSASSRPLPKGPKVPGNMTEGQKMLEAAVESHRLPDHFPELKISEAGFQRFLADSLSPDNLAHSDLSPRYQKKYERVLKEAVAGRHTPTQAISRLLEIFHKDLIMSLNQVAPMEVKDLVDVLGEYQGVDPQMAKEQLKWAQAQEPGATSFIRIRHPAKDLPAAMGEQRSQDIEFLRLLSSSLEELRVLPYQFSIYPNEGKPGLNTFSPDYWLKMFALRFNTDPVEIIPTLRWSTQGEMITMAEAGQRPLILSRSRSIIRSRKINKFSRFFKNGGKPSQMA